MRSDMLVSVNQKDKAELVQEITKLLDKNKELTSFEAANLIVREVVVPYAEISQAIYERLFFARSSKRDTPH